MIQSTLKAIEILRKNTMKKLQHGVRTDEKFSIMDIKLVVARLSYPVIHDNSK